MVSLRALIPRCALPRPGKHTDRHGHTPCLCPVSLERKTKCTGRENAAIGFPDGQPGAQDCKMHHNTYPILLALCGAVLSTLLSVHLLTPALSRTQGKSLVQFITAIGKGLLLDLHVISLTSKNVYRCD